MKSKLRVEVRNGPAMVIPGDDGSNVGNIADIEDDAKQLGIDVEKLKEVKRQLRAEVEFIKGEEE